jgi:peptide-N4-(N-acetyl-beta-glucosaminyl)asparagine amidase
VVDWTDHQWLEIWMPAGGEAGGAWVRLDPCEAAYDEPLLYSAGWGKNMTYVVALGDGALTDVTARYTADYNATLRDRPLSEAQVASALRWVAHTKGAPRLQPAPWR